MRLAAIAALFGAVAFTAPALAQEGTMPHEHWSFSGPFGTFDRAAAQRGFQIYKEVCSNCHSLKEAYYRNLEGIGLDAAQVKAVAASISVPTIGEDGQPAERPALPSDHFKAPFANEKAARAALNGALPPDLSVITSARQGGPDYVYGILTGYGEPPAGMKMGNGMYFNKMYPGHQIGMPQPLRDDAVTYTDGTKATLDQEAHDVVTFLYYIANPHMEERKRIGVKVVIFLAMLTGITYAVKRKVWSDVDH